MAPEKMLQLFDYLLDSEQGYAGQPDSVFELLVELWTSIVRSQCCSTDVVRQIDALIMIYRAIEQDE